MPRCRNPGAEAKLLRCQAKPPRCQGPDTEDANTREGAFQVPETCPHDFVNREVHDCLVSSLLSLLKLQENIIPTIHKLLSIIIIEACLAVSNNILTDITKTQEVMATRGDFEMASTNVNIGPCKGPPDSLPSKLL
ncbi:hypothetical protein PsorP6_000541 [Peronosclerospora sorghi]|uniref:Uncharacterized protein n=1 Tax=Peronosclerospora sorghi TaxID=230839 RepID=A0ACC0WST3_9STRA|nr:hypothetical protein PsorP6_000541 [Peronosclerospora sorghi]